LPARSPEEIRGSIVQARRELAGSVEDLRAKIGILTDWRRQIDEHRGVAIGAAVVVGFLVGRRLFARRGD
jgi:transposase-like protein